MNFINVVDIALGLMLLAAVVLGFGGGVVRLVFVIISFYLAVIVGTFFYEPFGYFLTWSIQAMTPGAATIVSFFVLVLVSTIVLTISLQKTFPTLRVPPFLSSIDQVGGSMLGMVAALFIGTVILGVLRFFFVFASVSSAGGDSNIPIMVLLQGDLYRSFLATFFVTLARPVFLLITPWFPGGLPPILSQLFV